MPSCGELVELDFVAIEEADIVEGGEIPLRDGHEAIAVVVELWRTGAHKVVEVAVVFVRQDFADLVEDGEAFSSSMGISMLPGRSCLVRRG